MSTLELYETLSDISGSMVRAAETGDWDRLIELEHAVAHLRDRLTEEDQRARLTDSERQRKVTLIKGILADDRKVRSFTEPWMEQVKRFLGDSTYGREPRTSGSGAVF